MVILACVCLCVRLDAAGVPLPPGAVRSLAGSTCRLPAGDSRRAKFLPAGRNVLVFDKSPSLLDPVRGRVIDPDPGRGLPVLTGTPDGVLTADTDGVVTLAGGGTFKLAPGMEQITVAADGRAAAVVLDVVRRNGVDETRHLVVTFDPKSGARTPVPIPEAGPVLGLAFTPDGRTLRVAHGGLTLSHFAAATGKLERETAYTLPSKLFTVGFSPDGVTAFGWGYIGNRPGLQGAAGLLRLSPGVSHGEPIAGGSPPSDAVPQFTPDGKRLWTHDGKRWRGFDTATGTEFARTPDTTPLDFGCLTADGTRLVATAYQTQFFVYDAATGECLHAPDLPDPPVGLACRGDNAVVAITGFRTMVFDLASGRKLAEYHANGRVPDCVSADGERVAEMFGEKQPGSVVLNTRTGDRTVLTPAPGFAYVFKFPAGPGVFGRGDNVLFRWPSPAAPPWKFPFKGEFLALSADGRWAVSRAGEEPLWEFTATGNRRLSLPPGLDRVEAAAFLPDGRLLAAGGDVKANGGRLMLLEPGTKRDLWLVKLDPEQLARTVAVSPDGFAAAVGYEKRDTQVIELATGRVRYTVPTAAQTVAFGPLGRTLIAGHRDTPLRVWDLWGDLDPPPSFDPNALKDFLGHPDPAQALPAMRALARASDAARERFAELLPPRRALTEAEVTVLIKNLDAPAFATREAAFKKLREQGDAAFPPLKEAAAATLSAEVRLKAETLLNVDVRIPTGDALRRLRAAEAALWAGTPAARKLADAWKR